MVIIFCGIPGSGKSTLARQLARKLEKIGKIVLFVSDDISHSVYKKISELLKENLKKADYIIIDATFYKRKWQRMVYKICGRDKVVTLDIRCPIKICLQRNKNCKKPISKKALYIIYHQIERPSVPVLTINTAKTPAKKFLPLILAKIIEKQYLNKENFSKFLKKFGQLYSEELGIDLKSKKASEIFKWFLASLLFGARISETIAKNTYLTFKKYKILTSRKIIKVDWDFLVKKIMKEGGYVRYDGKTSNELIRISKYLLENYKGNINLVHQKAKNKLDLKNKLQEFYSVGPATCRIFLRELRGIWEKADSDIGSFVKLAAKKLNLPQSLKELKIYWQRHKVKNYDFRNFEVALLRLGKNYFKE